MLKQESGVPTRDAFWIMPVSGDLEEVLRVRNRIKVLKEFDRELAAIGPGGGVLNEDKMLEAAILVDGATPDFVKKRHAAVIGVVRSLLLELTFDSEQDPMAREGVPNTQVQKLVREARGIEIAISIITSLLHPELGILSHISEHAYWHIKDVVRHLYRLCKQTIKGNQTNSLRLYPFLTTIQTHQGKGLLCMQVLKELFIDKKELILKLADDELLHPDAEYGQVGSIVRLLKDRPGFVWDPRYVDFLMNICTCNGDPVVSMQQCVTNKLIQQAAALLPRLQISQAQSGAETLRVLLPGTHKPSDDDLAHGYTEQEPWLDIAPFRHHHEKDGKQFDRASEIMQRAFESLSEQEQKFRCFVRASNLFGKVCLGRNQGALRELLCNPHFGLDYELILRVMGMESLPMLVRARFTTLMRILFVDRDPNVRRPLILYSRVRSGGRLQSLSFRTHAGSHDSHPDPLRADDPKRRDIPSASPQQMSNLRDFVLIDLERSVTQVTRKQKKGAVSRGQLEYLAALIDLSIEMIEFGLLTEKRDTVQADFSNVKKLFSSAFALIEPENQVTAVARWLVRSLPFLSLPLARSLALALARPRDRPDRARKAGHGCSKLGGGRAVAGATETGPPVYHGAFGSPRQLSHQVMIEREREAGRERERERQGGRER
jgi:hypothetical protein